LSHPLDSAAVVEQVVHSTMRPGCIHSFLKSCCHVIAMVRLNHSSAFLQSFVASALIRSSFRLCVVPRL
jgi:hypothetical protein